MPTYEYECTSCHKRHEVIQKMSDKPLKVCPYCKKKGLKKAIPSSLAFQFKGSGFYATDYQDTSKSSCSSCSSGSCSSCKCGH